MGLSLAHLAASVLLLSAGSGAAQGQVGAGTDAAFPGELVAFLAGALCAVAVMRFLGWRRPSLPVRGGASHAILNKLTSLGLALDAIDGALRQGSDRQPFPVGLGHLMRQDLESLEAIAHSLQPAKVPGHDST